MKRKEVVHKVRSVCGQITSIEAAKKGVVTIGNHAVLLKPEEMFVPRPPIIGCEYEKGTIVEVKTIEDDGVAVCSLTTTGKRE